MLPGSVTVAVKARPATLSDAFGLVMLYVRLVVPFNGMVEAPKDAVMDGAVPTLSVPLEADEPVPPLVDERLPVEADRLPVCEAVTLAETVQVLPGVAMAPPERAMELPPAVAVALPPQLFDRLGTEAIVTPVGRVVLKPMPLRATELAPGLVMVKVRVLEPLTGMALGLNAAELAGGATTEMLALVAAAPVPPSVEAGVPAAFEAVPAAVPFTETVTAQDALWASVPPERLMLDAPAFAVTEPLQVLVTPGVSATTSAAGRLSVNWRPVKSTATLGLFKVNVNVAVPLSGMLEAPNELAMVGAATTVTDGLEVLPSPASEDVTVTLVLRTPGLVPVTDTTSVQEELAASETPVRLIELDPATAVAVPPQLLVRPFSGVDTIRPDGRLTADLKPAPV